MEISNFYFLDPRPSRELLMAFASQNGLDADLLGKWFSEENGDFSSSEESSGGIYVFFKPIKQTRSLRINEKLS